MPYIPNCSRAKETLWELIDAISLYQLRTSLPTEPHTSTCARRRDRNAAISLIRACVSGSRNMRLHPTPRDLGTTSPILVRSPNDELQPFVSLY